MHYATILIASFTCATVIAVCIPLLIVLAVCHIFITYGILRHVLHGCLITYWLQMRLLCWHNLLIVLILWCLLAMQITTLV